MSAHRTSSAFLSVLHAAQNSDGQLTACTETNNAECFPSAENVASGCATEGLVGRCQIGTVCFTGQADTFLHECDAAQGCSFFAGVCFNKDAGFCDLPPVCPDGPGMCDDPHMKGIRGQQINWSGIDGAWYSLLKDEDAHLDVNVRLTAPLPDDFPDRQFITGLSVLSNSHSLVIEVKNPYVVDTNGCSHGVSPCLANGGLRAFVDGEEVEDMLAFCRDRHVVEGVTLSASNLPAGCRLFGRDKIWARVHDEKLQNKQFEDWILRFGGMAAPGLYTQYVEEHELADLQSTNAIFKIVTPAVTVRLNVGTNSQGGGDLDWDGRILPDLDFWQMKVGLHGLSVDHESLSGILGETARPVLDDDGREVMHGYGAFRGAVQDYRVSGPSGVDFAHLHKR